MTDGKTLLFIFVFLHQTGDSDVAKFEFCIPGKLKSETMQGHTIFFRCATIHYEHYEAMLKITDEHG